MPTGAAADGSDAPLMYATLDDGPDSRTPNLLPAAHPQHTGRCIQRRFEFFATFGQLRPHPFHGGAFGVTLRWAFDRGLEERFGDIRGFPIIAFAGDAGTRRPALCSTRHSTK